MNRFLFAGVFLALTVLSGCATRIQNSIPLDSSTLSAVGGRVGVAMAPLPKVDTEFPGAGCLLCIGVARGFHSRMTDHVRTLPIEDLPELAAQAGALLEKKGARTLVLKDPLKLDDLPSFDGEAVNFARKDFRGLRDKYNIDRLVVFQVSSLGVWRTYSSYVPVGEPYAVFNATVFMVNTQTNALEWFEPIALTRAAAKWDQPPEYPDLTNAYFQALEIGKTHLLKPLR